MPLSLKDVDKVLEVPPFVVRRPPTLPGGGWRSVVSLAMGRRPRAATVGAREGPSLPGVSVQV